MKVTEPALLKYRADIDGLRAVAVTAVVLYHAKVPGFEGGYVGVDVFFVISGYLITQLLTAPSLQSTAQLLRTFYLRRARRILPALFVMLAVCVPLAIAIYLPATLRDFGRSLMLAVAFLGNRAAQLQGGYFDAGENFTPLRHLWSIGVEEQFYLVYPLALIFIGKWSRISLGMALGCAGSASLLLAILAAPHWPVPNFYLLPTRAWELLMGAVVAAYPGLARNHGRTNEILAAAALAGLAAVFAYARVIRFPGPATVAACACTAMLLAVNAGGATRVARVLGLRPIVFTGLISYSLYLWHASILAFARYHNIHTIGPLGLCGLLGIIYGVAVASWALIEQPFRTAAVAPAPRVFVAAATAVALALAATGLWLVRSAGLPQRWDPQVLALAAGDPLRPVDHPECFGIPPERIAAGRLCSFGPQRESAPTVLVWGDSHAGVLLQTYREIAESSGIRIYYAIHGACWPLVGWEAASAGEYWRARCAEFNAAVVEAIARIKPQRIVLNAYWLDPGAALEPDFLKRGPQNEAAVGNAINNTLKAAGFPARSVCAVLTVPGYPYPVPYALAIARHRNLDPATLAVTRVEALRQFQTVESGFRRRADDHQLRITDPKDALCPTASCLMQSADGRPLYADANHLSAAGTRMLSGTLRRCFADLH